MHLPNRANGHAVIHLHTRSPTDSSTYRNPSANRAIQRHTQTRTHTLLKIHKQTISYAHMFDDVVPASETAPFCGLCCAEHPPLARVSYLFIYLIRLEVVRRTVDIS